MRRIFTGTTIAFTTLLLMHTACEPASNETVVTPGRDTIENPVKRGEYLVGIMGCGDCHSPKIMTERGPAPDPNFLLGGHPATIPLPKVDKRQLQSWVLFNMTNTATVGPWGATFAANITSDASGIGSWTEQQFFTAMRQGKWKGLENSRPLLPPMPWENFAQLTDEDLRAIFAYLKSTKPVKNIVPAPLSPEQL